LTAFVSKAQYSPILGNWKGFLLTDTTNADNQKGLPVLLSIFDDNDKGDFYGEMSIQYFYQTDVYKAKYIVSGNYDESTSTVFIEQERLVFYDILPKGLQWCFGSGTLQLKRNPSRKKNYLDGSMTTNCGDEEMRMVLIKK